MTVDGNRLLCGADYHFTVVTDAEVIFHFDKEFRIDLAIEVIGQFCKKLRAVH